MKIKEIRAISSEERKKKLEELKVELVKSRVNASKTGNSKAREIRKAIARILTLNNASSNEIEASSKKKESKLLKSKISREEQPSRRKFAAEGNS